MNSTSSSGESYTTPNLSPEISEVELRSLENSLDTFRNYLHETANVFEEYCHHINHLGENVQQQLEFPQETVTPHEQVSASITHTNSQEVSNIVQPQQTHSYNLRSSSSSNFISRLPTYPRTRPLFIFN